MKLQITIPTGIFLLFSFSVSAQAVREVISTPNAQHTIYESNNLTTVDDETKPFTGKYIVLNAKKEKMSEYTYVNGKLEGKYLEWKIKEDNIRFVSLEAFYKNGKLHGKYLKWDKYYRDTPYVEIEASYKNGILHGHYIERTRPGLRKTECDYVNGELNGKWINYTGYVGNERIQVLQFYKLGKRDSTHTWFNENGQPERIQHYNKNGQEHGLFQEFYADGKIKIEINYVNNSKHGQEKNYYKNGQLELLTNYVNDSKEGEEILYYENGKAKEKRRFKMDRKVGKWTWYNEDGTVNEETVY